MALVPFVTRHAPNGLVCAIDHLATETGVAMLRAGGTAADAAVAASAVLAVTCQHLCGMGGDLFALVHAGPGAPAVVNASGRAGSGADADRLRAEGASHMPAYGDIRSVPVPGCVDGWVTLHERFGRLDLATVLEPARRYAEDGFPASPLLALAALLMAGVEGADDFTAHGRLHTGQRVRRPGVARALAAVAAEGRAGFYEGEFGHALLALGAGEYEPADLARVQADWQEPLGLRVWDHDLWTVPPNSQGYLALAAAWIAEGLDLPSDPDDVRWAHLLVEAAKQAGYDRPAVLYEGADGASLLEPARLAGRRSAIDPERATSLPVPAAAGDTIHLAAADAEGMGVSLIQSNAAGFGPPDATGFGANLVVPGTGIFLQNRGIGFSLVRGDPAEYGPGRRPPHTLSPALVTRPDGKLYAVAGTMGGDGQPQILLQLLARLLPAGQDPATAVAAGRWVLGAGAGFDTWRDPADMRVLVEGHASPAWAPGLKQLGHRVEVIDAFSHTAGHAHVIMPGPDGVLSGASDPRALVGATAGY